MNFPIKNFKFKSKKWANGGFKVGILLKSKWSRQSSKRIKILVKKESTEVKKRWLKNKLAK